MPFITKLVRKLFIGISEDGETVTYEVFVGEVVAVLTIAAVLVLQFLFALVEKYTRKRKQLHQIASSAFRETALLGVAALILFLIQYWSDINETVLHQLEIIHICVWIIAFLYIMWVILLTVFSTRTGRLWASWEYQYSSNHTAYSALVSEAQRILTGMGPRANRAFSAESSTFVRWTNIIYLMLRHPILCLRYFQRLHIVRYVALRKRFIIRYGLQHDFPMWWYLNACKHHVFLRLVELPVLLWATVIFFLCIDLYLRTIWPWYFEHMTAAVVVVIMSTSGMFISFLVFVKMRSVTWIIMHRDYAMSGRFILDADTESVQQEEQQHSPSQDTIAHDDSPLITRHTSGTSTIGHQASSHSRLEDVIRSSLTNTARRTDYSSIIRERKLFWLGMPVLLLHLMQMALFAETTAIAVTVVLFEEIVEYLSSILWSFLCLSISVVMVIVFLSSIIPSYVLAIHVSNVVDVKLLTNAVLLHERHRLWVRKETLRVRTRPPSSQATPPPAKPSRYQKCKASTRRIVLSDKMQIAVNFAFLIQLFLISIVMSSYVSRLARILLFALDFSIVLFITLELLLRIWVIGVKDYFCPGSKKRLAWHLFDIVLVAAAIASSTVSAVESFGVDSPEPRGDNGAALYFAPLLAIRLLRGTVVSLAVPAVSGTPGTPSSIVRPAQAPESVMEAQEGKEGGESKQVDSTPAAVEMESKEMPGGVIVGPVVPPSVAHHYLFWQSSSDTDDSSPRLYQQAIQRSRSTRI